MSGVEDGREVAVAGHGGGLAPATMLSMVGQLARDPTTDVSKFEALLAMQERLEKREAERAFTAALVRATRGMPRVKKNGTIDLTRKDGTSGGSIPFARWEDVDAVIRPIMDREGFVLSFDSMPRTGEGGGMRIIATLRHEAGHSITSQLDLPLDTGPGRNNLQAMGSTLAYGKRYCAEMLLNIVREGVDDDGVSGGVKLILQPQIAEIEAAMKGLSSERQEGFLRYMGVDQVSDIQTRDFSKAMNALRTAQRRNG
jgi:hypothetical protein